MNSMTSSQQAAVAARGNVLVVAGAGTGKTQTLIERCCSLLMEENCALDEILMVTFTEAAAAEMRKRIRSRLSEKAFESIDTRLAQHLEEQMALLDTAYISTLHSFCLRMLREHFHDERLRLDPEFVVLTEEQVHQLRNKALETLLESHYGGESEDARAFRQFVIEQAGGAENRVHELIWQLHRYSRSLADPAGWCEKQLAMFAESEPAQWRRWLQSGFVEWREYWLRELKKFTETPNVANCLSALSALTANPALDTISEALRKIQEADSCKWPRGAVGAVRDQISDFFSDAEFLRSLLPEGDSEDPLAQDWNWSRGHMQTLLRLAREFGDLFDEAKREAGGVDFADLEQFALRLLWDPKSRGPTSLARDWQRRLKYLFVDEYQDINEAQDTILRAVSREGESANRFLVGDVKQSIYRFRLADPRIFQSYKKLWSESPGAGRTIPLSDNFRSREALLEFLNSFFALSMRAEIGGVAYDADAHLKFGAPENHAEFSRKTGARSHVEIHLCSKTKNDGPIDNGGAEPDGTDSVDLDAAEREARLLALQLKNLHREKFQIRDDDKKIFRAVEWRDMVVLLRSPRNKAEIFAREFHRAGLPLHVKRENFYSATEVSDLLSLLQLLDNPMQDLPLLAVLRSPLVGLSVNELAMIRAGQRQDRFWTALLRFGATRLKFSGEAGAIAAAAQPKVRDFLTSFDSWRRHSRQGALSDCMRAILDETRYETLVLAQERGEERLANVNRLLRLIRQFDPYQRQGLLRFLRFVRSQQDAEAEEEPASPDIADAVRLLSIHQSKGLEFPVVAVADLSKSFNFADLHADLMLDAEFGLCPKIAPPKINARYPSLPYWLARRRQKKELLGEELRLLYVAMTRARDRLILVGSVSPNQFEARWNGDGEAGTTSLLQARSYADWLAIWFANNCAASVEERDRGETELCRWRLHDDSSLVESVAPAAKENGKKVVHLSKDEAELLQSRLSTGYPFGVATNEPAKTSVSALRRRAMELFDQEEVTEVFKAPSRRKNFKAKKNTADVGTVHHRFLEHVSFERVNTARDLRAEAARMIDDGILSAAEVDWLKFDSLLAFWRSEFGRKILAHAPRIRRELAFTARFSPAELGELEVRQTFSSAPGLENEFIIVQGVADLAVILPEEIWLLDFKTDDVAGSELGGKIRMYEPQLRLYARALERIYRKPVTECRIHFLSCGETVPIQKNLTANLR
jgi:ATP-dependent helicase/nuclease subunit A